jgi:hypothetical protein
MDGGGGTVKGGELKGWWIERGGCIVGQGRRRYLGEKRQGGLGRQAVRAREKRAAGIGEEVTCKSAPVGWGLSGVFFKCPAPPLSLSLAFESE